MHRLKLETSLLSSNGDGYLRRRYIPLFKLAGFLRVEDTSSRYPHGLLLDGALHAQKGLR